MDTLLPDVLLPDVLCAGFSLPWSLRCVVGRAQQVRVAPASHPQPHENVRRRGSVLQAVGCVLRGRALADNRGRVAGYDCHRAAVQLGVHTQCWCVTPLPLPLLLLLLMLLMLLILQKQYEYIRHGTL